MKNIDSIVFLSCNKDFDVDMKNGSNRTFSVALNFSTELFYKILSIIGASEEKEISDIEKVNTVNCIFAELVKSPVDWVVENIAFESQLKLIESVLNSLTGMFEKEFLQMPDIKPEKEKPNSKNKEAKKRYDKQKDIERLQRQLKNKDHTFLMDEIALIMAKTHNTYSEIMNMPILVFKDLAKTIILNELRSDTDYNLAYLKDRASKLQKDLNNGSKETITKPSAPENTGANLMDLLIEY